MLRVSLIFLSLLLILHAMAGSQPVAADICVNEVLKVNHIQGRVVALWKGGEEPIPNAEVELKEFRDDEWHTKIKISADEQGFFNIENIPSGNYQILVSGKVFRSFGANVRLKASKSNPEKEIVVTLGIGIHDCGSARVQRIKRN
jgi:hypothetical protein